MSEDEETIKLPDELQQVIIDTVGALQAAGTDAEAVRELGHRISRVLDEHEEFDTAVVVGALVTVLYSVLKGSEAYVAKGLQS